MSNTHTIVIYDTEFTAWEGSASRRWSEEWESQEIIQIAAVSVHCSKKGARVDDTFNVLVRPNKHPHLSEYIQNLTGITQTMVDELGIDFSSALTAFHRFANQGLFPCFAWGKDKTILEMNAEWNKSPLPRFTYFGDLRHLIAQKQHDIAHINSGDLAQMLSIEIAGHAHNALHDVRSLAAALDYWIKNQTVSVSEIIAKK